MKKVMPFFTIILISCIAINVSALEQQQATVKVGDVDVPIFNVETSWGKMQFTYNEQINYNWDSNTHTYELEESTFQWVGTDNYIDINNKSYDSIKVELSYDSINEKVSGSFDKSAATISKDESLRFTLTLDGELSNNSTEYVKVGTINLVIK